MLLSIERTSSFDMHGKANLLKKSLQIKEMVARLQPHVASLIRTKVGYKKSGPMQRRDIEPVLL